MRSHRTPVPHPLGAHLMPPTEEPTPTAGVSSRPHVPGTSTCQNTAQAWDDSPSGAGGLRPHRHAGRRGGSAYASGIRSVAERVLSWLLPQLARAAFEPSKPCTPSGSPRGGTRSSGAWRGRECRACEVLSKPWGPRHLLPFVALGLNLHAWEGSSGGGGAIYRWGHAASVSAWA